MKAIADAIDSLSVRISLLARWLTLGLVIVSAYDTFMRFVFNNPPIWAYQMVCILGAIMYVLGWAYVMTTRRNVRMDVLYHLYPPRLKAALDALVQLVLFFPVMGVLLYMSFTWAVRAYVNQEIMATTLWYPPAWPLRFMVFLGFALYTLAGVSELIRRGYFAVKGKEL